MRWRFEPEPDSLPQVQVSEIVSFTQIKFGNHHATVKLIGLSPFWQPHVSATLSFVGSYQRF